MGEKTGKISKWLRVSLIASLLVAASAGVTEAVTIGGTSSFDTLDVGLDSVIAYGPDFPGGYVLSTTGVLSDIVYVQDGGIVNLAGGSIEYIMYIQGGEVYITDGSVGMLIDVSGGGVAVYGTDFAEYDEPDPIPLTAGEWIPSVSGVLMGSYEDGSPIDLLFYSDLPVYLVEPTPSGPIEIPIDIRPWSNDNRINLRSWGVVPVAIFSTSDFDATLLPLENIFLAGAPVRIRWLFGDYAAWYVDVNGDDRLDLLFQVETRDLDPTWFEDGGAYLAVCEEPDPDSTVLYLGWDEINLINGWCPWGAPYGWGRHGHGGACQQQARGHGKDVKAKKSHGRW